MSNHTLVSVLIGAGLAVLAAYGFLLALRAFSQ
jgi:hypothetical protein